MSKRGLSKYITFAAILGLIAAAISYFLKYKSFHKELEEDFHDFEDELEDGFYDAQEDITEEENVTRNYVPLNRDSEDKTTTQTEETSHTAEADIDVEYQLPPSKKEETDKKSNVQVSEDEEMYQS